MQSAKKIVLIFLVFLSLFLVLGLIIQILDYEGIEGFIFRTLYPKHDTVYGEKYIEENFRKIAVGDSKSHVISLIGSPLSASEEDNSDIWFYSKSAASTHYHLRIIQFSKTGRVIKIEHEYYID